MPVSITVSSENNMQKLMLQRRSLLWRIHFWAAVMATPFLIVAILTGLLYAISPQIESYLYGKLDTVDPQITARPLDEAIYAAIQAAPTNWGLYSVIPPFSNTDSVKVAFLPKANSGAVNSFNHAGHGTPSNNQLTNSNNNTAAQAFLRPSFGLPARSLVIYINPYNNEVLGQLLQSDRFTIWSKKLHSTYLQDGWRWIIEFAASWTLVMLITGIFLWLPVMRNAQAQSKTANRRLEWRYWHATIGIIMSVMSASILITGLTWSKNTGEQIRWARDALDQKSPRIPAHFRSKDQGLDHSIHNKEKSLHAQTMIPVQSMISWQQAWHGVKANAPDIAIELRAPVGKEGFWRANHVDKGDPTKRFDMLLDAYTAQPLFYSGWDDQPLFGKATAIGIPFHRGEFGLWNQALLILFGISLLFSFVSGWVMYFKRWRLGMSILPNLLPGAWKSISPWGILSAGFMMLAMPLLGISAAIILIVEGALQFKNYALNSR